MKDEFRFAFGVGEETNKSRVNTPSCNRLCSPGPRTGRVVRSERLSRTLQHVSLTGNRRWLGIEGER